MFADQTPVDWWWWLAALGDLARVVVSALAVVMVLALVVGMWWDQREE